MIQGFLAIVGLILGAIGIALAIIFYHKSRKFKAAFYSVRSFNLLTDSLSTLPAFSALYKGRQLVNLTATKILLWNSGSEIFSPSDMAPSDPIGIMLPEGTEILDAKVIATSVPANKASIKLPDKDANFAELLFDYFAPKEGCLITLLHTGGPDVQPQVVGTLKGFGLPRTHYPSKLLKFISNFIPYIALPTAFLSYIAFDSPFFKWPIAVLAFLGIIVIGVIVDESVTKRTGGYLDKGFGERFAPTDFT